MLPGLRSLLAATVLTIALLTFGLGAAALLRATHRTAALPWQPPQPVMFVGRDTTATPTLSLLRVEEPADATTTRPDSGATGAAPQSASETAAPAPRAPEPAPPESATVELPPPPEPALRDVTADVLAALATPADDAPAASSIVTASPAKPELDAPQTAAAPAAGPEPAADVAAGITASADAPAAEDYVSEPSAMVPDAIIAHPPLPRPRPHARAVRSKAVAATRRRVRAAAPRPAETARTQPVRSPLLDPFAPFGQPAFPQR